MLQSENEIGCNLNLSYDYIFAGVGTSASLLLLELHKRNLLHNLNILLIDPDNKTKNDKTFCFWSKASDTIQESLADLISHSWSTVEIDSTDKRSINPLQYHHVSSLDLYAKIQELTNQYNWQRTVAPVESVSSDDLGSFILVNDKKIRAQKIFDSRTPKFEEAAINEVHLYQSFIGWEIETSEPQQDKDAVRLMDFNVEQSGFTQFMYLLPFSKNRFLVELTRFGSQIIPETDAMHLLEKYIGNHFGNYSILSTEKGCIPMSNCRISNEQHQDVVLLGARNYRIKPSTGYAFKNMYSHAFEIADSIEKAKKEINFQQPKSSIIKKRFAFYDSLLLLILKDKPLVGKKIFSQLFQKADTQKVLEFLDEQTKVKDEIALFAKLPWAPFLGALFQKLSNSSSFRPLILLFYAFILSFLGNGTLLQSTIGYGFLLLGLIVVGIPHGAVDHLVESGNWQSKKVPLFILKYLGLAGLMGLFWYWFTDYALLVFILYSAWHFGQADGVHWKFKTITSFLWGASLLLYILGTHQEETNAILQTISAAELAFSLPYYSILPWLLWALIYKKPALAITAMWLMLATQLPLLMAFGLYFIGQHSVTSWKHLSIALKQSNRSIWLHSLPFQVGAWSILALFIFLWPANENYNLQSLNKFGVFFVFISCISFPHVLTMNMLYGRKRKNENLFV